MPEVMFMKQNPEFKDVHTTVLMVFIYEFIVYFTMLKESKQVVLDTHKSYTIPESCQAFILIPIPNFNSIHSWFCAQSGGLIRWLLLQIENFTLVDGMTHQHILNLIYMSHKSLG